MMLSVVIVTHSTIAHLHLAMELQQPFGLTAIFWTVSATAQHEHHRIVAL
jgi:hypothetical protein